THPEQMERRQDVRLPAQVGPGEQAAQHLQSLRSLGGDQVDLGVDPARVEAAEAQVSDTAAQVGIQAELQVGGAVPLEHSQCPLPQVCRHAAVKFDTFGCRDVDPLFDLRSAVA